MAAYAASFYVRLGSQHSLVLHSSAPQASSGRQAPLYVQIAKMTPCDKSHLALRFGLAFCLQGRYERQEANHAGRYQNPS